MSTVTVEQRVARAILVGTRWADNLNANAYDAEHRAKDIERARALRARERDIRDLLAILEGSEDAYIERLNRKAEAEFIERLNDHAFEQNGD